MKLKNAIQEPKVYFGLHMAEGVAEYREAGKDPHRVLVLENAIKQMDKSFSGKPVYVGHVSEVNLDKIQEEADGYVVKSFYNKADGKHWVEFIVVSDKGHSAIQSGWKLSNAYVIKKASSGGVWHGVDFDREIIEGEYEHLAIVDNPRYAESVVLTQDQFKEYNLKKETELLKLANSQTKKSETNNKGVSMKFNFFKKEKIENGLELESTSVVLPKSKKEVTVAEAIEAADTLHNMNGYANGDHFVKVGEEEMSVNELVEKYNGMCAEKKKNEEDAEKAKNEAAEKDEDKKENEDDKEDKKENKEEEKVDVEVKEKKENHIEAIKNAEKIANSVKVKTEVVQTSSDQVARGKSRYGSN